MVEAKHKKHYLGSPFIIQSTDEKDDLHLLTHIIAINEIAIEEAKKSNFLYATEEYAVPKKTKKSHSNTSSSSGFHTSNTSTTTPEEKSTKPIK